MRIRFEIEITEDVRGVKPTKKLLKELGADAAGAVCEHEKIEGNGVECDLIELLSQ